MKKAYLITAALATMAAAAVGPARADVDVNFSGPGVSGSLVLTFGGATDSKYPNAYEVTGISGTFSDSNNGLNIVNASVLSLVPITHDAPEVGNMLAPNDFSRFPIASNSAEGEFSYDNLFWPAGSPQTATDYPGAGGFLDIYGLLFNIDGGMVVDLWSNGVIPGVPVPLSYGVGVATTGDNNTGLDYVSDGVTATATPEASTWAMLALGFGALGLAGVRARRKTVAA